MILHRIGLPVSLGTIDARSFAGPAAKTSVTPGCSASRSPFPTVDGPVEPHGVARVACHLETNPDGPDMSGQQGSLLSDDAARVPSEAVRAWGDLKSTGPSRLRSGRRQQGSMMSGVLSSHGADCCPSLAPQGPLHHRVLRLPLELPTRSHTMSTRPRQQRRGGGRAWHPVDFLFPDRFPSGAKGLTGSGNM